MPYFGILVKFNLQRHLADNVSSNLLSCGRVKITLLEIWCHFLKSIGIHSVRCGRVYSTQYISGLQKVIRGQRTGCFTLNTPRNFIIYQA